MSIYDKSSLVLIPSGTKTGKVYSQKPVSGDGDFTFTRSSAATRVNADGVIEKETQNLLEYSNSFTSGDWDDTGSSFFTSGQSGYDGTNNAWLFTATSAGERIQLNISKTGVHTLSTYFKKGTADGVRMRVDSLGTDAHFYVNLIDGTQISASGEIATEINDIGSGWYRVVLTSNWINVSNIRIYPINTSGVDVSGTIYIQDAQLEQGLVARDYIETTTTAVEGGITDNVPRLDYTDSSCPALLLEPQRTNLVPISEGVPEDIQQSTLTKNYGISPEGVQNSLKVQKQGVNANDRILPIDNYNAVLVSGTSYSVSAFVKNIDVDGITTIACRLGSGGTLFRLGYEWNGSSLTKSALYGAGTRVNEILEDYGNGWWRVGFGFEADGTQGNMELDIDRDNGSDTTSIETWGWQLESATGDASYATSYIPTYGSSVTRNKDACFGAGTSATFNSTEGVLYFEGSALADDGTNRYLSINDGTTSNYIYFRYVSTSNQYLFRTQIGGTTINTLSAYLADTTENHKFAFKFKSGDYAMWVDGVEISTDTSSTTFAPNVLSNIEFSFPTDGGGGFPSKTKQVIVFPTALSDEELATLTTI
jgi:hypothetical protein